jgi:tetratricopeptide (TPR) repeat protein
MADRLLVDLDGNGRVSVGMWLDDDLPQMGTPHELAWPLDDEALEELRWYLEDYLRAPFGVYGERGQRIEAVLPEWGQAVFTSVFGGGLARDAYMRVRARRRPVEVVFRSASPGLLALPWELMVDPNGMMPLALDVAGVSRSLPVAETAETVAVPGGRLRVLMVISRPAGTGDVGYRIIARPLLERLEAVRGGVDLVVLRPPTLETLGATLAAAAGAGRPFQVVHFDGHGVLATRSGGAEAWAPLTFTGPAGEGVLVFEKPGGGAEEVPASRVAQVLATAGVPVVVLNACQSGAVGKDLEATVATRLLGAGVASVVAMAYSVYAVAAAEFMASFYERLFAGDTITTAVTAGRQRLYQANRRPSPKGELPLADWVVPVHYLRRDVSFPQARTDRPSQLPPLEQVLDQQRAAASAARSGRGDLDAVGSFIGRDDLFYELEAAARLQKVVLLHGPGGSGKTELAKAFGRWWRDTGGVEHPDWVFWHSFEPGVASFGLDGVITQIGLLLFGSDFARLELQQRREALEEVLAERQMLLIWDNFETVLSMPDPAGVTKPLDEAGRAELAEFLNHLTAHEGSAVIITSRASEDWLGGIRRITVGGLASHEAAEYAQDLMAPYPATAPRRARRAFGELMEWLDGHPLSMRLILPRLDTADPEVVLDGLRGTVPLPDQQGTEGSRTTSLPSSISYSFAHLADATRQLLPALSLFHRVADTDVLGIFSHVPGVPVRFREASKADWDVALEDATRVGLLTSLGGNMYQIHPALPTYLAAGWVRDEPENHDATRVAATEALLTAYGGLGVWLYQQIRIGDAGLAYTVIELQQRTLSSLLGYALEHGLWDDAQKIGQPLNRYWETRGLVEEADAWADRVRLASEGPDGTPPQLETGAGALWLYFTGNQANRQRAQYRLKDAEHTYQQILVMLNSQPANPQQQRHLAGGYHQLGWIAQDQGRLDDAEKWHRKALAIREELGNKPDMAATYHHLGMTAHGRGRLDEANDWYRKGLAIREKLGNKPDMAATYHQLGMIEQDRRRLDEADDWYRKSLVISESLGDKPTAATTYHELGNTAQVRGRLDEADDWYRKSLVISESLGDKRLMANTYHGLGMSAEGRGRLNEADDWYRRSLTISESLGNKPGMALTFRQLGRLAEAQGQLRKALEWVIRGVALFDEFPHPATGSAPDDLVRFNAQLGTSTLEKYWQQVTGSPLPPAVRGYVESSG